jgi:hypothetical protein
VRLRVGALTAAILVLFVVSAPAQAPVTWTGTWSTDFGDMTLTQSDAGVEGNYTHDQGHLTGSVSGDTLAGTWDEAPTRAGPYDKGYFEFTLNADKKSFDGRWKNLDDVDWRGGWDGTCKSDPCLQNGAAPAPPPGETRSFPAPDPGAVGTVSTPKLKRSTRTAVLTLGLTNAVGTPATRPAVAALTDKPDRPVRSRSRRQEAIMFCYVFMDVSVEDAAAGYDSRLLDEAMDQLPADQRARLRAFKVCLMLAEIALKRIEEGKPLSVAGAQAAQSPPCTALPARLVVTRRGVRIQRVRRPGLKIGCKSSETSMEVSVRPRKRKARLRSVVGPRVRLGVGRSGSDVAAPDDKLSVTTLQKG